MTDYERYIRTGELLALQKKPQELACHDELQFQMVHQVEELWMKLVLFTLEEAKKLMEENGDSLLRATHLLERAKMFIQLMTDQLHVLETMTPHEYHKVRTSLGKGSGAESPGFKRIREFSPSLWQPFKKLLSSRGLSLLELQSDPFRNYDLFLLSEGLLNLDEWFVIFREHHLQLVKHIIGGNVPSLRNVHASRYLEHEMKERFFPDLWEVRNQLSHKLGLPTGAQGGCPVEH